MAQSDMHMSFFLVLLIGLLLAGLVTVVALIAFKRTRKIGLTLAGLAVLGLFLSFSTVRVSHQSSMHEAQLQEAQLMLQQHESVVEHLQRQIASNPNEGVSRQLHDAQRRVEEARMRVPSTQFRAGQTTVRVETPLHGKATDDDGRLVLDSQMAAIQELSFVNGAGGNANGKRVVLTLQIEPHMNAAAAIQAVREELANNGDYPDGVGSPSISHQMSVRSAMATGDPTWFRAGGIMILLLMGLLVAGGLVFVTILARRGAGAAFATLLVAGASLGLLMAGAYFFASRSVGHVQYARTSSPPAEVYLDELTRPRINLEEAPSSHAEAVSADAVSEVPVPVEPATAQAAPAAPAHDVAAPEAELPTNGFTDEVEVEEAPPTLEAAVEEPSIEEPQMDAEPAVDDASSEEEQEAPAEEPQIDVEPTAETASEESIDELAAEVETVAESDERPNDAEAEEELSSDASAEQAAEEDAEEGDAEDAESPEVDSMETATVEQEEDHAISDEAMASVPAQVVDAPSAPTAVPDVDSPVAMDTPSPEAPKSPDTPLVDELAPAPISGDHPAAVTTDLFEAAHPVAGVDVVRRPSSVSDEQAPEWVQTFESSSARRRIGEVQQWVVTVGPFATLDQCYSELDWRLVEAVGEYAYQELAPPGRFISMQDAAWIRRNVCTAEYVHTRDTSVGAMKELYVLMEFTPSVRDQLYKRWEEHVRRDRVAALAAAAAGVVGLLALVFGLLKLDTLTKGYYSKRLFIGVPAAIIGVGMVIALVS